jgi:hypothetical protein
VSGTELRPQKIHPFVLALHNNPASSCLEAPLDKLAVISRANIRTIGTKGVHTNLQIVVGPHHVEKLPFVKCFQLEVDLLRGELLEHPSSCEIL